MSISFDDLTEKKPQQQPPQQPQDELLSLFPTPVLIAQYPVPYEKELRIYSRIFPCRRENKGGDVGNKIHYNRQSENTFVLDEPELANVRAVHSGPKSLSLHERSCALKMRW